jgi:hypothetical protein
VAILPFARATGLTDLVEPAGVPAAAAAAAGDFEGGGLAGPGLVGGFDAIAPGDVAGAVAGEGEVAGDGLAAFAEATAPGEAGSSLWRGTCPACGRRTFLFLWRACADVREVLAHAHLRK